MFMKPIFNQVCKQSAFSNVMSSRNTILISRFIMVIDDLNTIPYGGYITIFIFNYA